MAGVEAISTTALYPILASKAFPWAYDYPLVSSLGGEHWKLRTWYICFLDDDGRCERRRIER